MELWGRRRGDNYQRGHFKGGDSERENNRKIERNDEETVVASADDIWDEEKYSKKWRIDGRNWMRVHDSECLITASSGQSGSQKEGKVNNSLSPKTSFRNRRERTFVKEEFSDSNWIFSQKQHDFVHIVFFYVSQFRSGAEKARKEWEKLRRSLLDRMKRWTAHGFS